VLIETMRREGFELGISRPRVLFGTDEDGSRTEPYETVVVDVDDEYAGTVVKRCSAQGRADRMKPRAGKTRIIFSALARPHRLSRRIPVRHARHRDHEPPVRKVRPYKGAIEGRPNGVLISNATGEAVAYALNGLEDRGVLFVSPQEKVYEGMIIGENAKPDDLEVNPLKSKQLTNFRSTGKDDAIRLTPPRVMTLEQAIAYIDDDEMVEVTPQSIRLRKAILDPNERKQGFAQEGRRDATSLSGL
jgi:GTP-binding protein